MARIRKRAFELAAHLANRYPTLPNDSKVSIRQAISTQESAAIRRDPNGRQRQPRDMDLLQVAREFIVLYGQLSNVDRKIIDINLRGVLEIEARPKAHARSPESGQPPVKHNLRKERGAQPRRAQQMDERKAPQGRSKPLKKRDRQKKQTDSDPWSVRQCPRCRHVIGPGMNHACPVKDRPFDQRSSSVSTVPGGGPGTGRKR